MSSATLAAAAAASASSFRPWQGRWFSCVPRCSSCMQPMCASSSFVYNKLTRRRPAHTPMPNCRVSTAR
eukprot:2660306-Pleurochrysis_carterae.AAC.2